MRLRDLQKAAKILEYDDLQHQLREEKLNKELKLFKKAVEKRMKEEIRTRH